MFISLAKFNVEKWLSELIMQEDRDTYKAMSIDQQRVVRLAFLYGTLKERDRI